MDDVSVSGIGYGGRIGGLVGFNTDSSITDCCTFGGSVSGTGESVKVGGLVGQNYDGSITTCFANSSVSGTGNDAQVGGLVGSNWTGSITDCFASGSVDGTSMVGGLVGSNTNTGWWYENSITNCYAIGLVTGIVYVGGLVGRDDNSGVLTACFWDIQTSGIMDGVGNLEPDPSGVEGKTTAEMKRYITFKYAGWDFTETDGIPPDWTIGYSYPELAWMGIIIECIKLPLLMDYIGQWKRGEISMPTLMDYIARWKDGLGCE